MASLIRRRGMSKSRHSRRKVPLKRSRTEFALSARTGVPSIARPYLRFKLRSIVDKADPPAEQKPTFSDDRNHARLGRRGASRQRDDNGACGSLVNAPEKASRPEFSIREFVFALLLGSQNYFLRNFSPQ